MWHPLLELLDTSNLPFCKQIFVNSHMVKFITMQDKNNNEIIINNNIYLQSKIPGKYSLIRA